MATASFVKGKAGAMSGKAIFKKGSDDIWTGGAGSKPINSRLMGIYIKEAFEVKITDHVVFNADNGDVYIKLYAEILVELKKHTENNKGASGWIKVGKAMNLSGASKEITEYTAQRKTDVQNNQYQEDHPNESGTTPDEGVAEGEYLDVSFSGLGLDDSVEVNETMEDLMTTSMHGIFGLPYQWDEYADRRIVDADGNELAFGRKYAEKIVARLPLVFLTPGRPSFMPGADKDSKDNVLATLTEKMVGADDSVISKALDKFLDTENVGANKFYAMNFAQEEYYRFVNPMCQIMAKNMGLTQTYDIKMGKKSKVNFTTFDWSKALSDNFTNYWSSASAIPFYTDAATSVSDSFSNDTTASWLAGQAKDVSSKAKELQFLVGSASAALDNNVITDLIDGFREQIANITTSKSASSFMINVGTSLASIAQGGAMLFPEIWDNSSIGRSYPINIKLRSPDCDNLSIYLNIVVPFIHLLAFVAPQMIGKNVNTYGSPFLVRAYSKSMYNIDMGIITSMDVSRGKEGGWNVNGIPTEMDISLTIKDLYEAFSIVGWDKNLKISSIFSKKQNNALKIIKNTAMMDYLGNLAGLNLNQPEITKNIQMYQMLTTNNVKNWPNRQYMKLQQAIDARLRNLYRPGSV